MKCAENVHSQLSRAAEIADSSSAEGACGTPGCSLPKGHVVNHHDPSVTGYNYNTFITEGAGCVRNSWPQPVEHGKYLFSESLDPRTRYDVSTSDCKKKRDLVIGHRERTSLWIWTCLKHSMVAGYHVIKRGEGKRDAVCSLYRFKRKSPKVVMVDFACHAEECGLNWLPEYFKDTAFLHDIFHGYGHVCSSRFGSHDLPSKPCANSSLMEQFNSFLQPLRGLLCSGATKVRIRNAFDGMVCMIMYYFSVSISFKQKCSGWTSSCLSGIIGNGLKQGELTLSLQNSNEITYESLHVLWVFCIFP